VGEKGRRLSEEKERKEKMASKELIKGLEKSLETQGEKLVKMFKGVALFKIDGANYLVDLKNGGGKVYFDKESEPKPDVTLTMSDDVFVKLASGKLNPQMAFIQGKLKISGNIALSMKLQPVLKAAQPSAKL
jgi:putative sterol carrier protein